MQAYDPRGKEVPGSCRLKQKSQGSSDLNLGPVSSLEMEEEVKGHPKGPTESIAQGEVEERPEQHKGKQLLQGKWLSH